MASSRWVGWVRCSLVGVTIQRPVDDVFAVLINVENAPKWSRAVEERMTTTGPFAVGSRRRAVVKSFGTRSENEAEVTEFEPNRRLALRTTEAPFTARIAIDLEGFGGRRRIKWVADFEPGGLLKPIGPLLAAYYHRSFQKDLDNLKRLMETGAL